MMFLNTPSIIMIDYTTRSPVAQNTLTLSADSKKPTQVSVPPFYIQLETPLDAGSSNDGTGKNISKRMLVTNFYGFSAVSRNNSFKLSDLKWSITYTSPSTSKSITLQCTQPSCYAALYNAPVLLLCLNRQFGEKANDMCGTTIKIRAYNDTAAAEIEVPVHNRFYWFDAKKVRQQIEDRVREPWRIDQGSSGLCVMAALYYAMIKRNKAGYLKPASYQDLATELHRTGTYDINGYIIGPTLSWEMYDANPEEERFKEMMMYEVDWIVLAGTQSGVSYFYNGFEHGGVRGFLNRLDSGESMDMLRDLLEKIAGFSSVQDCINKNWLGFDEVTLSQYDAVEKLKKMDAAKQRGKCELIMSVNARMLEEKNPGAHAIVYEGSLKSYKGKLLGSTIQQEIIQFNVYTWGASPGDLLHYYGNSNIEMMGWDVISPSTSGITLKRFADNFYGYLEADY